MSEATRAENVALKPYDLEAHYQELEQKITAAGIPADLGRVRAAFECADRAHSGQKRRDGSPYVSHCIAAAIITAEMGLDEDSIIAALLHDTIEDTSLTHEDIARSFGTSVADIVEGVTKLTRVQYTSVEEQQMENMRKMLLAMAKDIRVILIKMADRLHNMRTMAYQSEEKQRIKSLETMEIYAPIAHRLGMQKIKWELEDLSLLYLDPAGYKAITDALDERMPTLEKFMGEMRAQIRERLEADGHAEDTVLVLFTDHYCKYFSDTELIEAIKGTSDHNLLSNVPFVIWTEGITPQVSEKYVSTMDIAPTIVDLFSLDTDLRYYIGNDMFGPDGGVVYFRNYAWYDGKTYDTGNDASTNPAVLAMREQVREQIDVSQDTFRSDYFAYLQKRSGETETK